MKAILTVGGMTLTEAQAFKNPSDILKAVERLIASGVPMVIVGGGDGTFGAVAKLFARKSTILGILPLGTGNSFARDLGISEQIEVACDTILRGKVAKVDLGIVGDRDFVNVATVGLSTKIALGLNKEVKKRFGKWAYLFSLMVALRKVEPFHVWLDLESGSHEFDCLQLVVGNGRFHAGPFPISTDASITGGWLAIYALASVRKADFIKLALHMLGGRQALLPEVKSFRVKQGRLTTTPVQRITIDGETIIDTPVEFGIVPHALRVMVPICFEETSRSTQT